MSHPGPSDVTHVPGRETRRLYGSQVAVPGAGAERNGVEDEAFPELDALLSCARLAHPPSTFSSQVMLCVAQRGVRQRAVRRLRRAMTVVVLLMAMVAGTVWLVSAVRASNAPILGGVAQVLEQLAAILQSLAVAARVIARAIPGNAGVLFCTWIVAALGVSALWFAALTRARPSPARA